MQRFKIAFRRTVEMLADPRVGEIGGVTFPVKFTDRLRMLNRVSRANALKSTVIAKLLDLVPALRGPVFATLADRRVDLAALVEDDAALAEHIRDNVAGQFHPVGTCRMGRADDPQRCRRYGGTRARLCRTARRRRLHHADADARQHQYSDHHAGGKNRRRHRRRRGRVIPMTCRH